MGFVRIKIKNEYEKPGDIVHRGFLRVLASLNDNVLTGSDGAYIYGIKEGETIRELFTGNIINTPYCETVEDGDAKLAKVRELVESNSEQCKRLREAIKYAYGEENSIDVEWNMEVNAGDRAVEAIGHDNGYTNIYPYDRIYINDWSKLGIKFEASAEILKKLGTKINVKVRFDRSKPHENIKNVHIVYHGDDSLPRAVEKLASEEGFKK